MPVNVELSDSMLFSFDWLYHSLPAVAPETSIVGHDYLSIALEFDNGQDLTWMWSKFLAEGTSFTCPLPWWSERETHYVLDSGFDGLGKWKSHSRNIFDDYAEAVGRPSKKIVGIWLIANNLFSKTRGVCKLSQYHPHGRGRTGIFLLMRNPLQGGNSRLPSGIK